MKKEVRDKIIARNRQYVYEFLLIHPCIDCGEGDPDVLQFDHIELVGKAGKRVGDYMQASLATLQSQIDLCEVRCANCHIKRTRRQTNKSRAVYTPTPRVTYGAVD